ncbi:uncharacterized protein LOC113391604 [Vanessa tameamea]|uniref:Uncharacterized protein LOC113391604 n=1 Tax=Vanessa tameamea TaxID=334116 RepID=A0A8B8HFZ2_VANTA|nr:uncharacterized protein LOC113391604 isoform X2 [Vanessa tameamea]
MEYISHIPRTYIYYNAGRTRVHACRTRMYALTALHAHVVAFVLSAVTVNALSVALDRRVIEGAILASLARPCAWLPLSLSRDGVTASLAATSYAVSFVFSPIAHLLLCGRIALPSLRGVLITASSALVPFAIGNLSSKTEIDGTINKISALAILYSECCSLLREAEGSLYVIDVMATLFLVVSWLTTVAASSYLYVKCGLLTLPEAHVLLLVATPKSTHIEWAAPPCAAGGLARLPAVFGAPAQALLLAALAPPGASRDELPT